MITRRHLLLAIAATCLVTMFLLMIVPIFSLPYDPTLDVNHDGKIDGKDIALPALSYGTAGDPTVPVNVTTSICNYELVTGAIVWNSTTPSRIATPTFCCGGYSRLCILICTNTSANLVSPDPNPIQIWLRYITWANGNSSQRFIQNEAFSWNVTIYNGISGFYSEPFLTETKGPYCDLHFEIPLGISNPTSSVNLYYAGYFRNE